METIKILINWYYQICKYNEAKVASSKNVIYINSKEKKYKLT